MTQILLYQVDSATSELLYAGHSKPDELRVISTPQEMAEALTAGPGKIDLIVVGTTIADPVRVAQQTYSLSRDTGVLLLAEDIHLHQLTSALRFSPLIGVNTTCVAVENSSEVFAAFERLVRVVRQRRAHRAALAAADSKIQAQSTPIPQGTYIEHLLHRAPIGVVAIDAVGRALAWNAFASTLTGVVERNALGVPFQDHFPEPWHSQIETQIQNVVAMPHSPLPPLVVQDKGRSMEINMSLLQGTHKNSRILLILRDITVQARAEHEAMEATRLLISANKDLRLARDQAVNASRAKSIFLTNMSHELRTPLNAIIGYSEMLQEQATEEQREDLVTDLGRIRAAGRHLLMLITEILDISKIEAGKMELYVSRFDPRAVIDEAASTVQPLVESNRNRFTVICDPNLGYMQTDETKLRQILFNLLSNSSKFTEDGQITLTVTREQQPEGDLLSFAVADSGIGMNDQQLASLFQEFTQVDESPTRRHGGTGLGLALSRRFSRMMGGDITVASIPGSGSTFTARIPAMITTPGSVQPDTDRLPVEALQPGAQPPIAYSPNTVLVIDDDPAVHHLMRGLLEKERFRMVSAMDGKRGIELAREIVPRAIILDILMPEIDGWAVLSEIKADPRLADIPVIIATILDHKNLGFALGATDYMTKPVERERLLSILRRYQCDLQNCHVLIVEDDLDTRQLLDRLLVFAGCTTLLAVNGRQALEAVRKRVPDIVLLDLMMPEMDGLEFLERLREQPQWRAIPVVVTTAKELDKEAREKLTGEVTRVLNKGQFTRDDLLQEICDIVASLGHAPDPASNGRPAGQ